MLLIKILYTYIKCIIVFFYIANDIPDRASFTRRTSPMLFIPTLHEADSILSIACLYYKHIFIIKPYSSLYLLS